MEVETVLAAVRRELGNDVALGRIGPQKERRVRCRGQSAHQIDARPDDTSVGARERHLLAYDGREITVERQ